MLLNAFDSVIGAINQAGEFLGLGWIAVIGFSLLLLTIIISFIRAQLSVELKTARAVQRINLYLESNPFVTDENLVEFNKLMKKIPSSMREQWQKYMVNRDDVPSKYLNEINCMEKPFKTSVYQQVIAQVKTLTVCIAIICFVLCLGALNAVSSIATILTQSLLISLVIVLIGMLYTLFLKSRKNAIVSELYYNFGNFGRYLDRAVSTLPDYVDYEILFTRKEIVNGIPALQEYLQKRASYEQEQLKKAKDSQVEHAEYDFSKLGTNGALLMEKSMKECEYYLGNRKRILSEIAEIQTNEDVLVKNYDEKNKMSQRKMRDIQESLDRLKEKLDSTTNMIVANDLRKQRETEIQKQRVLEKEMTDENNQFEQEKAKYEANIADKKKEIEDARANVEATLNSEFKGYADKIYDEVKKQCEDQVKAEVDGLKEEKTSLVAAIEERDKYIVEKNTVLDEKGAQLEELNAKLTAQESAIAENNDLTKELSKKDKEIFEAKKELESRNIEIVKVQQQLEAYKKYNIKEIYRYFDANGKEFYYDNNDEPYYLDENNKVVYYSQVSRQTTNTEQQKVASVEEPIVSEEVVEEPFKEEKVAEPEIEAVAPQGETVEVEGKFSFDDEDDTKYKAKKAEENNDFDLSQYEGMGSSKSKERPKTFLDEIKWNNSNDAAYFDNYIPDINAPETITPAIEEVKPAEEKFDSSEEIEYVKVFPADDKKSNDISEIEKQISAEQEKLDVEHKNLTKNLEKTKKLAEKPKAKKASVKKPAKKASAKKSTAKKASTKKSTTKKTTAKKATVKKASIKKSGTKKAVKPSSKKVATKKVTTKKKTGNNGSDGDLSLAEFNEALKKVLKDIDKEGK